MSNVALSHPQPVTHQAGNQIPVAVVANEEVWIVTVPCGAQLMPDRLCCVLCKPLQVRPYLKPARHNNLIGSSSNMG